MKTILVPTDFSAHAINAVNYAAYLASKMNSRLILLHTFHFPVTYTEVPAAVQTAQGIEIEAETELNHLAAQLKKSTGNDITVDTINQEGLLIDILKNVVATEAVNLIVMGTQGASGMEELLIGSHTAYVVEQLNCPVLVIPADTVFKAPSKIMYATDFQFNDFHHINQVAEIAQAYEAEIIITHVSANPENKAEEEDLMDWFMEIAETNVTYPNISFRSFTGANVQEKLNEAVNELGVDLLCMSTVRRSFFEKLYKGSLTKKMAYHTQIPLLAFHIQEPNRL